MYGLALNSKYGVNQIMIIIIHVIVIIIIYILLLFTIQINSLDTMTVYRLCRKRVKTT